MCGGDFMSKNPEEAMDFLSYVAEVSRGWDEPHRGEVGKMKSQPNAFHAKAGMYTLNEDVDMKAKLSALTIPVAREMFGEQANVIGQFKPIAMLRMAILTTQVGGIIQIFHGSQEHLSTNNRLNHLNHPNKLQKIDNLQYSISRLTNLNTVQEKGRFPSQPHQNPKGIHEVETHEGESSQVRDVKALITLRSGKKVESPTPKPYGREGRRRERRGGNERKEERYQ
ncbi:hypothetical protein CK203_059238 [Vitis vinifera]|uniref:Uncharacterized protein n=1 Tax=Vitis vinifera TaxID=29760 RepID=A0A438GEB4_VITVI|nr:hypothetical protein CK203_059238 [Vitis vinifera]